MAIIQARARRKPTGGRYTSTLSKRKYMIGRSPSMTKLSKANTTRTIRVMGAGTKRRMLAAKSANLLDPKTKKCVTAAITTVTENPANRHFVRRNVITKGTIIMTEKGKARVTNRPGQEGFINAVLL